jgi:hypothetical protein
MLKAINTTIAVTLTDGMSEIMQPMHRQKQRRASIKLEAESTAWEPILPHEN